LIRGFSASQGYHLLKISAIIATGFAAAVVVVVIAVKG